MITAIIIFLASSCFSFFGSLQLGPVNLFVINSVLHRNKRVAFFVALGGSLPEFIYCTLAVYAGKLLEESPGFQLGFRYTFVVILFITAYLFWKKKPGVITPENAGKIRENDLKDFLKGFSLAGLNPQLLPFWMFVFVFFNSINILQIKSGWHNFSFILGSGIGAFVFLITLLLIVNKYKLKLLTYINNRYYFKALSFLFLLIAIHQIILLNHAR